MESLTDYFRRWQCHVTIRLSQFESLGHSVGKIVWRHHAVAYFQTNCIPRRRNRRYIPTVLPMSLCRRYISTDFETELFPSVIITDGKIPLVILLVFSGFLVVENLMLLSVTTFAYFLSIILPSLPLIVLDAE
jgi:hypothetical protein